MTSLRTPIKRCLAFVMAIMCTTTLLNAATSTFQQGVNGYTNTFDNNLNQNAPAVVQGNNAIVLVDNNAPVSHGLIRFEGIFGNGPGQVPLNATISSATLTFFTSNVGDPINFHRMLIPWSEMDTWDSLVNGVSADDVEMVSTPEGQISPNTVNVTVSLDVTAIVQGWFAGTFPNHGWGMLNTVGDGWQFSSSENGTVANRPSLTIVFDAPCSPISIVTHPANQMANEGGSVTFSVIVTGSDPIYQWYKDGSPIMDATNSFYQIPFVLRSDAGTYRVNVQNTCAPSNVDSQNATLSVINDEIPPKVVCAYGSNDALTVFVTFDEAVTNALSPTSYTITPAAGGDNLQVTAVAYADTTFTSVALTIESTTPMAAGIAYNLFVSGVEDRFANALINTPAIPIARFPTSIALPINDTHMWRYSNPTSNVSLGTAWRAVNYDDSGWSNGLALLGVEGAALPEPLRTTFAGYVAGAVRTFYFRTHFNFPDKASNAVLCLRTVIDDAAAFHLNGVEVFRLRLPEVYDHNTEGTGGAVGDAVYEGPFYVCVTNLVQGDNVLAVEVHQTGTGSSDIVMGVEVSALVPTLDPIVITQDPVGGTRNEGDSITFTVGFTGTNPRFQWYKDGNPIPDGTNSTYTIGLVRDTDAGQYHVVISNEIPSTDTSATATLTVIPDNTPPTIVCVYFSGPSNDLVVVYSEIVTNALTADDPFRYEIVPGDGSINPSVASSSYTSGTNFGTTVTLVLDPTTPRVPGITYDLNILPGIADRFGNVIANNSLVPVAAFPRVVVDLASTWRYNSATNLGTNWIPKLYNDSAWASGVAIFDGKLDSLFPSGYTNRISLDGQPVNTHISLSNETSTAALSAVYFRTHFNYSGSPSAVLCFRHFVDDGVVYYLNGVEILRIGMPAGVIANGTLAARTEGDADFEGPVCACVSNLMAGDNVLAAEVHQVNIGSSDITFGAELSVLQLTPPSSLTITHAAGGQINLIWSGPAGSVLEAASEVTGPWSSTGVNQSQNQTFAPTGTMRFFRVREP